MGVSIKDRGSGAASVSRAQIQLSRATTIEQLHTSLAAAAAGMRVVSVHFLDGNKLLPLLSEQDISRVIVVGAKTLYVSADVNWPTHGGLDLEMDDSRSDVTLVETEDADSGSDVDNFS